VSGGTVNATPVASEGMRGPDVDPVAMVGALDHRRVERGLSWNCTAGFATSMVPGVRITGWLELPGARFVVAGSW